MVDAYLNATDTYQHAKNRGVRAMPLAAFEVAEIARRRRAGWWIRQGLSLLSCGLVVAVGWFVAMAVQP